MKKVLQVDVTGISHDYHSQWAKLFWALDTSNPRIKDPRANLIRILTESPLKKYEEYFPPAEYENVITPQNRGAVTRLDALVETVNRDFLKLSPEEIMQLYEQAKLLIYGQ